MNFLVNYTYAERIWLGGLVALVLVLLIVGVYLAAGLFGARSLVRRELSAYFLSPIAYVMLVAFLAVIGYRFYLTVDQLTKSGPHGVEYPMQFLFSILPRGVVGTNEWWVELLSGVAFWLVYLLIPPLLTMRLFAEERNSGTLEVLMTAPLRDWQVVLSKYAACLMFYLFLWVPTLVYLPVLFDLQSVEVHLTWTPWTLLVVGGLAGIVLALLSVVLPLGTGGRAVGALLFLAGAACAGVGAWGNARYETERLIGLTAGPLLQQQVMPVAASYLGLALAGAMFLALGMLVSSLVRSQMVAALVSVMLSLGFILAGFWRPEEDGGGAVAQILSSFSIPLHFSHDFGRGIVDTRHLTLYGSVALFCLFLTVRSLESRRWR